MTVKIPEELKADMPRNKFGKMLAATPVVMAVIATLLAGLASSEMTRPNTTARSPRSSSPRQGTSGVSFRPSG